MRGHIGLEILSAGSTLGLNVEAALRPPQTAPKSRMWKRHCRLSGLSSGAGRAAECALPWFAFGLCVPVAALFLGACSTVRSCRGASPSVHACCLPHGNKQDGLRYLAFLFRRSRSPFVRSHGVGAVICLGWFTSGLCVYLWRSRRVTGRRGTRGTGLAARR